MSLAIGDFLVISTNSFILARSFSLSLPAAGVGVTGFSISSNAFCASISAAITLGSLLSCKSAIIFLINAISFSNLAAGAGAAAGAGVASASISIPKSSFKMFVKPCLIDSLTCESHPFAGNGSPGFCPD